MTPPVDQVSLVRRWLRSWRVEHVEIVSPLSADAAECRLAAG